MWLKEFQIALVLKDTEKLDALMQEVPAFKEAEDIDSLLSLLKEATLLVQQLKDETQTAMIQMQKNINYLKSTQERQASKFDINS